MNSTTNKIPWRFAGSRLKTCCGKLAGCACCRPKKGIASIQEHFSGNFSSTINGQRFFSFNKCKTDSCKLKCKTNGMILPLNNFKSAVNGKHYSILTDSNLNCQSTNIIYLITCNICKFQYVGETKRSFETRIKEHIGNIKRYEDNPKAYSGYQYIYKHLCCDDLHKSTPLEKRIRFQIIEKIKVIDDDKDNPTAIRTLRLKRELFWISKLRTAYPLGLNDMIAGFGIQGQATDAGFDDYNHLRIANICEAPPDCSKRRNRHRLKKRGDCTDEQFQLFSQKLTETYLNNPLKIETLITSKSRKFLTRFITSHHHNQLNRKVKYLLKAQTNYIRKTKPQKIDITKTDWTIKFTHKILDDINIDSILRQPNLKFKLPQNIKNKVNIRKIFTFDKPTSSKILNYNKVLRSSNITSYQEISEIACDCADSPFINTHFNHIITGDLHIIKEPGLRKLCSFGTKFRDIPCLNHNKIKKQFKTDIEKLIRKFLKNSRSLSQH